MQNATNAKGDVHSVKILIGAANTNSIFGKEGEQVGCACRK